MLIRIINIIFLKNIRFRKKLSRLDCPAYLNLGSGPKGLQDPSWINVDGYKYENVDYCMDFSRPFPIPENTFDGIFCEHVLEHFTLEDGQKMLRECLRALKTEGCIRIIVPDGEKIIKSYFENPEELLRHRLGNAASPIGVRSPMEAVNSYFRQRYEHQIAYDGPLLIHQLLDAGFEKIAVKAYRVGDASSEIMLDNEVYEWQSIYIEATKPPN